MNAGQKIIDEITKAGLCHATCAHDENHGCVVVWSSGAAEQLEGIIPQLVSDMDVEQQRLRATVRRYADALQSARAELERQLTLWNSIENDSFARSALNMEVKRIDRALTPNQ